MCWVIALKDPAKWWEVNLPPTKDSCEENAERGGSQAGEGLLPRRQLRQTGETGTVRLRPPLASWWRPHPALLTPLL